MLYVVLFILRFYPFLAIPLALVLFEVGVFHYNRRERLAMFLGLGGAGICFVTSVIWIVFDGYYRAAPFLRGWLGF